MARYVVYCQFSRCRLGFLYLFSALAYLFGARCRLFALSSGRCHCHTKISSSVASLKSTMVSSFCCRLAQVVLEMRSLNRCFFSTCSRKECSGLSGTDFSWARCTFCPQTYSIKSRSVHEVDAGFISCYFASLLLASVLRFVILCKNFTCTCTVYYWLYLL